MAGPMLWVDDLRDPPEPGWTVARTSDAAIAQLDRYRWHVMSLDHDLGGDDTTRRVVLWLCEGGDDYWPLEIRCHSDNNVGVGWIVGMVERYHPTQHRCPVLKTCDYPLHGAA